MRASATVMFSDRLEQVVYGALEPTYRPPGHSCVGNPTNAGGAADDFGRPAECGSGCGPTLTRRSGMRERVPA
jgi:hypothetical protein